MYTRFIGPDDVYLRYALWILLAYILLVIYNYQRYIKAVAKTVRYEKYQTVDNLLILQTRVEGDQLDLRLNQLILSIH